MHRHQLSARRGRALESACLREPQTGKQRSGFRFAVVGARGTLFVLQRMQVDATGAAGAAVVLLISSGPNRRFKIVPGVIVAPHYRLTGGQGLLTCIPNSTNLTERERERERERVSRRFHASLHNDLKSGILSSKFHF